MSLFGRQAAHKSEKEKGRRGEGDYLLTYKSGRTTRLRPDLNAWTLKFISKPIGIPVNFRYVTTCAV